MGKNCERPQKKYMVLCANNDAAMTKNLMDSIEGIANQLRKKLPEIGGTVDRIHNNEIHVQGPSEEAVNNICKTINSDRSLAVIRYISYKETGSRN